jgi:predicted nucleic acid-binding Zn ribbon protein
MGNRSKANSGSGDGPQRLGRALDRLMGTLRAPSVDVLDSVFTRWPEIVGDDVAAHSRPLSIDGATLVIAAEDSTWASELRWLENEVIARVAEVSKSDQISTLNVRVARRK